eukprot:scaffold258565_cov28-Tisochrysis_lutea.AAC.1
MFGLLSLEMNEIGCESAPASPRPILARGSVGNVSRAVFQKGRRRLLPNTPSARSCTGIAETTAASPLLQAMITIQGLCLCARACYFLSQHPPLPPPPHARPSSFILAAIAASLAALRSASAAFLASVASASANSFSLIGSPRPPPACSPARVAKARCTTVPTDPPSSLAPWTRTLPPTPTPDDDLIIARPNDPSSPKHKRDVNTPQGFCSATPLASTLAAHACIATSQSAHTAPKGAPSSAAAVLAAAICANCGVVCSKWTPQSSWRRRGARARHDQSASSRGDGLLVPLLVLAPPAASGWPRPYSAFSAGRPRSTRSTSHAPEAPLAPMPSMLPIDAAASTPPVRKTAARRVS